MVKMKKSGWALVRVIGDRCSPQTIQTRCTLYQQYMTDEALQRAAKSYGGITDKPFLSPRQAKKDICKVGVGFEEISIFLKERAYGLYGVSVGCCHTSCQLLIRVYYYIQPQIGHFLMSCRCWMYAIPYPIRGILLCQFIEHFLIIEQDSCVVYSNSSNNLCTRSY